MEKQKPAVSRAIDGLDSVVAVLEDRVKRMNTAFSGVLKPDAPDPGCGKKDQTGRPRTCEVADICSTWRSGCGWWLRC